LSITRIDIDDGALAEAMRLMGTTAKEDVVNAARRSDERTASR
jgi:Arc/MetJ family transcription regulator